MIISLSDIMSVKNKAKHIDAVLESDSFKLNGMDYVIAQKETVSLDIISLGDRSISDRKVSITARTRLTIIVPCSRCLEDVAVSFDIDRSKELDFSESDTDRIKDLDELNYIDGYNLDVDLLIFDEILLDFPLQVLCKPGCKGICKTCGTNLNRKTCDCEQSVGDPRMSVIQDIFKNYKEV